MSKEMTLIVLGILTAVTPFLGFPESWRSVFLVVFGAGVVGIGFILRSRALGGSSSSPWKTFTEHNPHRRMNDIREEYGRDKPTRAQ